MDFKHVFFIGVAGTGMSALAQYLSGMGISVSGSDRYFEQGKALDIKEKLEAAGVRCFLQNGEGIKTQTDLVVVSTAIEDTVPEVRKAKEVGIPILRRSELLAWIAETKKTIAIGGTSGKSTSSAMLFDILQEAGMDPGIISGAGLTSLIEKGKIGNAWVGKGDWLIIEADESDGSIVQYHPEIGVLLNVDKDHQELDELMLLFGQFRDHCKSAFMVNQANAKAASLSNGLFDFSAHDSIPAKVMATDFIQEGLEIRFQVQGHAFKLNGIGRHNMENALAAIAVSSYLGVELKVAAKALSKYQGIYRRNQLLGNKSGVMVIDDYAHNPVKCAAAIKACQPIAPKVIAWFQPHGYGPTRFLKHDFIEEIAAALRPEDEIWMSEIFYAGGNAVKDISANDLIIGIQSKGKQAFFVENRNDFLQTVRAHLQAPCVLLLMGARDPGLETFGKEILKSSDFMAMLLKNIKGIAGVRDKDEMLRGEALKNLSVLEKGFILLEGDEVAAVGKMEDLASKITALPDEQIDLEGRYVLPAWCDSHTHIVFAGSRETEFVDKINGLSYAEIAAKGGGILNSARKLQDATEDELFAAAWNRLQELSAQGTGAIEIKSGYGLSVEGELKMLRVIKKLKEKSDVLIRASFLGAHTYPAAFKENHEGYLSMIIDEMLPVIAKEKLADYIDVFCESGFFSPEETERICLAGAHYGLKPKLHVNQLNSIGGIETGLKMKAVSLDHLETLNENEISLLAASDTVSTLLPTAAFFLRMPFQPARQLIESGAAVALASDMNPGSSPSGNMNFVVSLSCIQMRMLPEESINAATINGAYAMELQDQVGSIRVGKKANLIITKPIPSLAYLPYAFGSNLIENVLIKGKFIH